RERDSAGPHRGLELRPSGALSLPAAHPSAQGIGVSHRVDVRQQRVEPPESLEPAPTDEMGGAVDGRDGRGVPGNGGEGSEGPVRDLRRLRRAEKSEVIRLLLPAALLLSACSAPDERAPRAAVLLFITTDCPIANSFAPEIKRIIAEYGPQGAAFSIIYTDLTQPLEVVRRHAAEYGYGSAVQQ